MCTERPGLDKCMTELEVGDTLFGLAIRSIRSMHGSFSDYYLGKKESDFDRSTMVLLIQQTASGDLIFNFFFFG
jgi:hypothetical protein